MVKAFSYVRFSSEKQELGHSLQRQVSMAEAYAARHALDLQPIKYTDLGVSAFKGLNAVEGALKAFTDAVDDGRIPKGSYLLVESLDRISRLPVNDALHIFQGIIRRGITIVTLQDEQIYSSASINENWTKLIVALAVMSRANEESKIKSDRVRKAYDAKRKRGEVITSKVPSWLSYDKDTNQWTVHAALAALVNRIYDMVLEGKGQIQIAKRLNEEGVPTLKGTRNVKQADGEVVKEEIEWSQSLIAAILRNPAVYGTYVQKSGGDEVKDDYFPPIMTKQKFLEVRKITSERKSVGSSRPKQSNLFSGQAYCFFCGARMKYQPTRPGYAYLHCTASYFGGKTCDAAQFPYGIAEQAFLNHRLNNQERMLIVKPDKHSGDMLALEAELGQLKTQQEKMIKLAYSMPDIEAVASELRRLQDSIVNVQARIEAAKLPALTADDLEAAQKLFTRHEELRKAGEAGEQELADLRHKMKDAINRQVERFEFIPQANKRADRIREKAAEEYAWALERGRITAESSDLMLITYKTSGKKRLLDATPYLNAVAAGRRKAAADRRERLKEEKK